jgi:DNA-binding MarR family transcriptional regulator
MREAAPIELDRFLPFRLAVLSTAISRGLAEVYGDRFQLTIADWRILANLGHAGALYAGELAERSSLDKPKVTRALQRMEAAGVIVRAVDLEDRRQARLSLTDKGRKMYGEVAKIALAWEKDLLSPLAPEDRQALERVLGQLHARVGEMRRTYAASHQKASANGRSTDDETL